LPCSLKNQRSKTWLQKKHIITERPAIDREELDKQLAPRKADENEEIWKLLETLRELGEPSAPPRSTAPSENCFISANFIIPDIGIGVLVSS